MIGPSEGEKICHVGVAGRQPCQLRGLGAPQLPAVLVDDVDAAAIPVQSVQYVIGARPAATDLLGEVLDEDSGARAWAAPSSTCAS